MLLGHKELANFLNTSVTTTWYLEKRGMLPPATKKKVGGKVYSVWDEVQIEEFRKTWKPWKRK